MSNRTYIDKGQIATVNVFGERVVGRIYTKTFPKKTFLGLTFRSEETKFGLDSDFSRSDGYNSKDDILYFHLNGRYIDGRWYYYSDGAYRYDEKDDTIYGCGYISIHLLNGESYIKFFKNEREMTIYIDDLGVTNKLYGLEYDGRYN